MQPLLKRLGLAGAPDWKGEFEILAVRKGMAASAIAEIDRLSRTGGLSTQDAEELRQAYAEHAANLDESLQALNLRDEDLRRERLRSVRRHLLQVQKSVVRERQYEGEISEDSARDLLAELDAQVHTLDETPEIVLTAEPTLHQIPEPNVDRAHQ
jgi:hypothetical protein